MHRVRPLLIDSARRHAALEVKRFAEEPENWYSPGDGEPAPGDNPAYCCRFMFGFRTVFTVTLNEEHQAYRHLTVALTVPYGGAAGDTAGRPALPSAVACFELATLFGFTGWDSQAPTRCPGDWYVREHPHHACTELGQLWEGAQRALTLPEEGL